jgi:hypothetical protein
VQTNFDRLQSPPKTASIYLGSPMRSPLRSPLITLRSPCFHPPYTPKPIEGSALGPLGPPSFVGRDRADGHIMRFEHLEQVMNPAIDAAIGHGEAREPFSNGRGSWRPSASRVAPRRPLGTAPTAAERPESVSVNDCHQSRKSLRDCVTAISNLSVFRVSM